MKTLKNYFKKLNSLHLENKINPNLIFGFFLTLVLLYPAIQILFFHSSPFYMNAYDEYSYLQYEFGKSMAGFGRYLQYLSTVFHELKFSGGYQNFILDLITPIILYISISKTLTNFKFPKLQAKHLTNIIIFTPLILLTTNPYMAKLFGHIYQNETFLKFITTPEAWFLPILRTPEPQLSITLLSIGIYFSTKHKKPYLLFLLTPFLYSFITLTLITFLFTYYSHQFLIKHLKNKQLPSVISPLLSFLLISSLLKTYFSFLVNEAFLIASTNTHLPLLSTTFIISILTFLVTKKFLKPKKLTFTNQSILIALITTPLITTNTQIISGYLSQPNSFEQYINIFFPILIITLLIKKSQIQFSKIFLIALLPLLLITTNLLFKQHQIILNANHQDFLNFQNLQNTTDIEIQLTKNHKKVIIDNPYLATKITAFHKPKLHPTAFDYAQTYYKVFTPESLQNYINAKHFLNKNDLLSEKIITHIETLDKAYRYLNMDFILLHLNRRKTPPIQFNDFSQITPDPNQEFHFYPTKN